MYIFFKNREGGGGKKNISYPDSQFYAPDSYKYKQKGEEGKGLKKKKMYMSGRRPAKWGRRRGCPACAAVPLHGGAGTPARFQGNRRRRSGTSGQLSL